MRKTLTLAFAFISMILLTACSTQWREADVDFDDQYVFEQVSELEVAGANSSNMSLFLDLARNPEANSIIYFSEGPRQSGSCGECYFSYRF